MKILYDSKNHTIRELKPNGKVHKMTRLENEIFIHLIESDYITSFSVMKLINCNDYHLIQYYLRKLKKRLTIKKKKYCGIKLYDDIWII